MNSYSLAYHTVMAAFKGRRGGGGASTPSSRALVPLDIRKVNRDLLDAPKLLENLVPLSSHIFCMYL